MLSAWKNQKVWSGEAVDTINRTLSDPRDRSLAVNIFLGTIQKLKLIDYYICSLADRSSDSIDRNAMLILEAAAYQIIFLERVPDSAAVNEAAELSKKYSKKATGFINAVLRKLSTLSESNYLPEIEISDQCERLSVKYSCSRDLSSYLVSEYGTDFAEDSLKGFNTTPDTTIQVNTLRISTEEFRSLLIANHISFQEAIDFPGSFSVRDIQIPKLPGYEDGMFFVQDNAAATVSHIAGLKPEMNILDCCASPGGKSFSAAIEMNGTGAIISCDISKKKIVRIEEGVHRLRLENVACRVMNARVYYPEFEDAFDAVICDAPCSGYGVIRKKPEIKYKDFHEIQKLPDVQRDILNNVSKYVKPGGILIYSTCTILKRENEDVVGRFIETHDQFVAEDFTYSAFQSVNGCLTFWPHIDGTDGFFVSKFRRL